MKKTIAIAAVTAALCAASFMAGRLTHGNGSNSSMNDGMVQTVIVHDTTRQILPIPTKEYVYKDRVVEVPVRDTVHVHHSDTVYIGIPYEVREYRDSNYFAKVGGYRPELLEIETYNRTVTVLPKERRHSVYAGMSAGYVGGPAVFPGIGYEYRSGRFAAGGGVGYDAVNTKAAVEVHLSFDLFGW